MSQSGMLFQTQMLSNQNYTGQIRRDDVVTLCEENPSVTLDDGTVVDISQACPILAAWDLHDNLDCRGAHVFRETIPIHGGPESQGVFNKVTARFDAGTGGYVDPTSGSSWIQATA